MSKWEPVQRCVYYNDGFSYIIGEISERGQGYEWGTKIWVRREYCDGDWGVRATLDEAKAACDASVLRCRARFAKRAGIDEDRIKVGS